MQNKSNRTENKERTREERIFNSLKTIPPSDGNFKSALDDADADTIREVLKVIPEENNKTKIKVLTSKLNALEKARPAVLREDLLKRKVALEEKGWTIDASNKIAVKHFEARKVNAKFEGAVSVEHLLTQAEALELSYSGDSDSGGDEKTVSNAETVRSIPIGKIIPSPFEPQTRRRAKFVENEIAALAGSITQFGLRQPILVRPHFDDFEIVFGERRFLASKKAGFENINCFVERLSDAEVIELQYEENHNRLEPDPLDDAFTFHYLQSEKGYTIEDLAIKFAMDKSSVRRRLKLNDLIAEGKELLSSGKLPLGHAVFMAALPTDAQQEIIDEEILFDYGDQILSLAEFKEEVEAEIVRDLSNAPFDTSDPRLHIKNLICPNCPQRTGYEPKLFDEDFAKGDKCLNKSCFQMKTNTNLRIKHQEIAEKRVMHAPTEATGARGRGDGTDEKSGQNVSSVPLVTERSFVDKSELPVKGKILTNQKLMSEPECEFSEIGLAIAGEKKGQEVWTCQNDKCPKHHPEAIAPGDQQSGPTDYELQQKERRFSEEVKKTKCVKIFGEAVKNLTDTNVFWQYDDLIQQLIKRCWSKLSYDERNLFCTVFKDWKKLPKDNFNDRQIDSFIKSLDKEKQSQFLFLFSFYPVGFYSTSNPEEFEEFSNRFTKLNFAVIDAETRLELAPEEFKPLADLNLQYVKNGHPDRVQNFWWTKPENKE